MNKKSIKKKFISDLISKPLMKNRIKIALIFTTIYYLLFNPVALVMHHKYSWFSFYGLVDILKDVASVYVFLFLIFFGFCFSRIIFTITSLFLFITSSVSSYYTNSLNALPSRQIVKFLFEAESRDAEELISIKLIFWLLFCIGMWIFAFITSGLKKLNKSIKYSMICLFVLFSTYFNVWTNITKPSYKVLIEYFPLVYVYNTYLHLSSVSNVEERLDIYKNGTFADNSQEDINFIFIIGETARYDHFGINGYERDTTPRLSKLEGLMSFKARSCSSSTCNSISCMLSVNGSKNIEESFKQTSVLSVFTKLGFDTSWIGTQSIYKCLKSACKTSNIYNDVNFASYGDTISLKINDHDERMFPKLESLLESSDKKKLIVIHTSGSHWNYDNRYPLAFKKFSPTCADSKIKKDYSSCKKEYLFNSYDNSISYTDYIIAEVIDRMKNKNSIVIYVSDHGESLGENNRFGHGVDDFEEQRIVPLLVWMSDKYKEKNKEKFENIKSRLGDDLSHDYIFHSLLDCASIDSNLLNKNMSICAPKQQ